MVSLTFDFERLIDSDHATLFVYIVFISAGPDKALLGDDRSVRLSNILLSLVGDNSGFLADGSAAGYKIFLAADSDESLSSLDRTIGLAIVEIAAVCYQAGIGLDRSA